LYIFVAGAVVGFWAFGFGAGGGREEDGVVDEEEGDGEGEEEDDCFAWNFASFAAFFASFSGFIFSLCVWVWCGRRVEVDEKWSGGEKKKKSWGRVNEYSIRVSGGMNANNGRLGR